MSFIRNFGSSFPLPPPRIYCRILAFSRVTEFGFHPGPGSRRILVISRSLKYCIPYRTMRISLENALRTVVCNGLSKVSSFKNYFTSYPELKMDDFSSRRYGNFIFRAEGTSKRYVDFLKSGRFQIYRGINKDHCGYTSFPFFFFLFPHIEISWIVDIRGTVSSANLRDLSFHKSVLWSWQ